MKKAPITFRKGRKTPWLSSGLLRQSVLYYFFLQLGPVFTPIYRGSIATEFDMI